MKHLPHPSLCATVAISAALAFGTQVSAQDAVLVADPPPPVAEAPPAPTATIVLPPTLAAPPPAVDAPAASPPPAAKTERASPRAAEARTVPTAAKAVEAAASPPPEPVAPAPSAEFIAPVAIPEAAPATPRDSVRSAVDFPDELLAAIGLGALGLGVVGVIGMRRRRRHEADMADGIHEAEAARAGEPPATAMRDGRALLPAYADTEMRGTAFVMPAGSVPTGAARQRLLEEMVAAAPDEQNPFTSAKARRKRARIILQSREHRLGQQSAAPFDWRTYRSSKTRDSLESPLIDA